MEKFGDLFFYNKKHSGKCEVDDKNNISVTVYECDLLDGPDKIIARLENSRYEIYKNFLVDHNIGYYKFNASYMIEEDNIHAKKEKNIKKFEFTFKSLSQWLNLNLIKEEDDNIKIELPKEIVLLNCEELKISIKFYKKVQKDYFNTNTIINVEPFIVVDSKEIVEIEKIKEIIHIITRFFALFIGFTENINSIFVYEIDVLEKRRLLIINTDFSNNLIAKDVYGIHNFRTKFEDFKTGNIELIFSKWWDLNKCKDFRRVIEQYYSPYVGRCIEERFLANVRALEELYELKFNNDNEKIEEDLYVDLSDFYKKNNEELKGIFRNNIKSFKNKYAKSYVDKMQKIHEELIKSIIGAYNMRTSLDVKIKKMDECKVLEQVSNDKDFINKEKKDNEIITVYNYTANTRNYHTHLSSRNSNIIDDVVLDKYSRAIEKILIYNLMKSVDVDSKKIKLILEKDSFFELLQYM